MLGKRSCRRPWDFAQRRSCGCPLAANRIAGGGQLICRRERSDARIRADVVFDTLIPLGSDGSERTVRRAVAEMKADCR
jgi:hypothetical protein